MAEFYLKRNRPDRAASIYESIARGFTDSGEASATAGEDPTARDDLQWRLQIWKAFADACLDANQVDRAARGYERVLDLLQRPELIRELDASTLGPIHESIGNLRFRQHHLDQAIEAYERAAQYASQGSGQRSLEHLTMLNNIASCHYAKGTEESLMRARELAREALLVSVRLRGAEGEAVRSIRENLENIVAAEKHK